MKDPRLNRRAVLGAVAALPFAGTHAWAQGAAELELRSLRIGGRRISYLVRKAQSGGAKRLMLLCFGGGDANRGIAEYYDRVYTPETVYADHRVILPVGPRGRLYFQFSDRDARALVAALSEREAIEGRGLVSGVSNGGRAAFRFAQAVPKAFRGIVAMPGALGAPIVPAEWSNYAVVLAYGTQDARWKAHSARAHAALRGRVGALELLTLAGQGHVIGPEFDIDPVYARLKMLEERLGR